ncbi:hypothetical protein P3T27_007976 [Kitasatospora sp. MAA19]|uniref:hypothetical protein n=1 Tax=unclassified Kitasatospora TaxID=2633591 RepID=UPI0024767F21|nr:hypothetical protein [Kitasatospora sp. MAA19]MDH6711223.1 hypothetical protein [Kitasatospora sp. MAA19]
MTEHDDNTWDLMREMHELTVLAAALRSSDAAGTTTPEQKRDYLLRRAVVDLEHLDRPELSEDDPDAYAEAVRSASRLRDHDVRYGSQRGPVPASDSCWRGPEGAVRYVREERRHG